MLNFLLLSVCLSLGFLGGATGCVHARTVLFCDVFNAKLITAEFDIMTRQSITTLVMSQDTGKIMFFYCDIRVRVVGSMQTSVLSDYICFFL